MGMISRDNRYWYGQKAKVVMIIADTIKGKGVSFMETIYNGIMRFLRRNKSRRRAKNCYDKDIRDALFDEIIALGKGSACRFDYR